MELLRFNTPGSLEITYLFHFGDDFLKKFKSITFDKEEQGCGIPELENRVKRRVTDDDVIKPS